MKNKFITSTIIIASLGLTACTKNYSTTQIIDGQFSNSTEKLNTTNSINAFTKLIISDDKNLALAEILAAPLANENKEVVKNLVKDLSAEEIKNILNDAQNENSILKQLFLFRGNSSLSGNDLFKQSILQDFFGLEKNKLNTEQVQLTAATFNYLKSKSLNEIMESYNNILDESTKAVAKDVIVDVAEKNPELAKKLETEVINTESLEAFLCKIKKSKEFVDKIDQTFAGSDLNIKEELVTLGTVAVGTLIYNEIKVSKSFQDLVRKFKTVKNQIVEINNHVKKITLAVRAIKDSAEKMKSDSLEFNTNLKNVKDDLKESVETAKIAYKSSERVQGDKIVNFLYNKVLTDNQKNDAINSESAITRLSDNLDKHLSNTFKASAAMADNLSNIIDLTNKISTELNLEIPKDLQKAINTASDVATGVKIASDLVQSFMSGGVLSAVGVLNSGPVSSLLGTKGGDPAINAALGKIDGKLSEVIESQKRMLEIQVETVKMIKNLALMIDDYHQKEMMALASLRDFQLVNLEISKSELNSDIRQCENLLNYKLKDHNIATASLDLEKYYGNFKTYNDLTILVKSSGENNFSRCQNAIVDVFGSATINESKILSIYNSSENDNLYAFQRDTYQPLNQLLHYFATEAGLNRQILHLPIKDISNLDTKRYQLTSIDEDNSSNNSIPYNLDQLISTKTLERYLSSYLILYPLLELDKNDWSLPISDLINTYYANNQGSGSRGYFFMKNALDLIHSAIAQESILAGESLIPYIYKTMGSDLLSGAKSSQNLNGFEGDTSKLLSSIRSNKLLMKNYLKYTVLKNTTILYNLDGYKTALEQTTDAKKLLPYLTNKNANITIVRNDNSWAISMDNIIINLPTLEEVKNNQVTYSENMERLLRMQESVINALIKLSPAQYRPMKEREGLAKILLMNQI